MIFYLLIRCIKDFLKTKIVVLVTHQLHFLSNSTKILVLNQYRSQTFDNLEMLLKSGLDYATLVDQHQTVNKEQESDDLTEKSSRSKGVSTNLTPKTKSFRSSMRRLSLKSNTSAISDLHIDSPIFQNLDNLSEEEQKTGSVPGRVYWNYFKIGSGIVFAFFTLIFNIASQIFHSSNDMWLAHWTNRLSNLNKSPSIDFNNASVSAQSSDLWNFVSPTDMSSSILLYFTLVTVLFFTTLLRAIFYFQMSYRASISLHISMLDKILKTPIHFFEENPAGKTNKIRL